MKEWIILFCGILWSSIAAAQGIVCIDPITITEDDKSTKSYPESTFTVSIDDLPAQTITTNSCGVFSNLSLTVSHMVRIHGDEKPEASFTFTFKTKGSNHLRLWYRTQYGTWQLWKLGRKHECAYLKIKKESSSNQAMQATP